MIEQLRYNDVLRDIFETSADGILVVKEDGTILMANPVCEQVFGYGSAELVDQNIDVLFPSDLGEQHENHNKPFKKNPKTSVVNKTIDLRGMKKDGTGFGLDVHSSTALFDDEPVTIAFLRGTSKPNNDFIEIKAASKERQDSKGQFDTLINNLQGIVYRCRNDRDWTMLNISEGCIPITGYSPDEFLNGTVHFSHIIMHEDLEQVWNTTQRALDNKKSFSLTYRIKDKKGRIKYLRGLGQGVFDTHGNLEAIEGIITDVTLQKRLELNLKAHRTKTKALLEAIPDIIIIQDLEGNYLEIIENDKETLMAPSKDVIGKNMKDILPPNIYRTIKEAQQKTIKTNCVQLVEYELEIEGQWKSFETRIVPMNNHNLLSIVRDISGNKKLEREISASKTKAHAILNALPDLFLVYDENANILEVHASDPSLLSAPKEELLGKNIKDTMPLHIAKTYIDTLKKVRETNRMEILQITTESLKGSVDFEIRFVPLSENKTLSISRDITNANVNAKLLNINARALDSANNSILIVDAIKPDLPIIYCNEAFEKMTGYSKEEVYGKNCSFLQNEDRNQKEIDIMRNAIEKGQACSVTLRNYKKDGTLFWNQLNITPVQNADNELTHFIGVQNDITERIQRENLKDGINQILELIVEDKPIKKISNAIIETLEAYFKNSMASISLLEKEQLSLFNLASPNLPKTYTDSIEGIVIGPNPICFGTAAWSKKEVIVTDINSDDHWGDFKEIAVKNGLRSCWSYPIMSSYNQVLGTLTIYNGGAREPSGKERSIILNLSNIASIAIEKHFNTITLEENRKQLEEYTNDLEEKVQERTHEVKATIQELVQSNLRLEDQISVAEQARKNAIASQYLTTEIAKSFPKGFIAVYNVDFQLILLEGETLAELGLTPLSFNEMSIDDIPVISKARKTRIKEDIRKTLLGEHLSFEIEYKNRYFSVNTTPLFDENNHISHASMVYNDISEQKTIEFNIQKALKKERDLNELKSRFVSMASHEFRTPLAVIQTSAILIGKQNEPGKEGKREKYIAQIEKNIDHLVSILNDFLTLSKLKEEVIVASPEHFDAIQFSRMVVNEFKVHLKKHQSIDLTTDSAELFVYLDTQLFRHILTNLLSNASKFSAGDSTIDFKISQREGTLSLEITDQGKGIPEEEQKQVFEPFFRASNASNIEGTGLGLYIAKHFAELMGGIIHFKSRLNSGTIFWVELPIHEK